MQGGGGSDRMAAGLEPALDRASMACARRGAQLTELRRQVLRLVLAAEQPVSAYVLLDRLRAERPGAAPPTVYRALDFLQEQGLIHKVERLNAFVGCAEAGHHDHGHDHHACGPECDVPVGHPHQFLICRRCGATQEISDAAVIAAVTAATARAGFAALHATVEVEGICGRCGAEASQG
jgi:Fur family zinc uptake transcriptional regulator